MKKYLMGIIALALAIGFSAFTTLEKKTKEQDSFFWYNLSGGSLGFGEEPNNGCTATGTDCARGFITEPDDPTTEVPDETRAQN